MANEKLNLAGKLAKIAATLGGIDKDGHNSQQGFDFISYEHFYATLRPLFGEHKILIVPSMETVEESTYETAKGGSGWRTRVTIKETIIDAESGEQIVAQAIGSANDTGDKSLGKAITEAEKRWLFKLLKVSSKDDVDPDNDTPDPRKEKPKAAPAPRTAAPKPPATAPKAAAPAPAAEEEGDHWCPVHNCRFYRNKNEKTGQVWYSHKIKEGPGAGGYCNEADLPKADAPATDEGPELEWGDDR